MVEQDPEPDTASTATAKPKYTWQRALNARDARAEGGPAPRPQKPASGANLRPAVQSGPADRRGDSGPKKKSASEVNVSAHGAAKSSKVSGLSQHARVETEDESTQLLKKTASSKPNVSAQGAPVAVTASKGLKRAWVEDEDEAPQPKKKASACTSKISKDDVVQPPSKNGKSSKPGFLAHGTSVTVKASKAAKRVRVRDEAGDATQPKKKAKTA